MNPQRIQRRRIAGWRMSEGAVYVGRRTKWGNPAIVERYVRPDHTAFTAWAPDDQGNLTNLLLQSFSRHEAQQAAVDWFHLNLPHVCPIERVHDLRGKDLACWCPLDQPCHAGVLLRVANGGAP